LPKFFRDFFRLQAAFRKARRNLELSARLVYKALRIEVCSGFVAVRFRRHLLVWQEAT
jgi:hypothetical protein